MCLLDFFMQMIHTFLFGNCLAKFIPFKINAKKRSRYFGIECVYWWSLSGSNRWPPACKAGALPAELKPHVYLNSMVGLNGLEPTTSPLSGVRSNHLSYRPVSIECPYIIPWDISVSYTHLDVYKRQIHIFIKLRIWGNIVYFHR